MLKIKSGRINLSILFPISKTTLYKVVSRGFVFQPLFRFEFGFGFGFGYGQSVKED